MYYIIQRKYQNIMYQIDKPIKLFKFLFEMFDSIKCKNINEFKFQIKKYKKKTQTNQQTKNHQNQLHLSVTQERQISVLPFQLTGITMVFHGLWIVQCWHWAQILEENRTEGSDLLSNLWTRIKEFWKNSSLISHCLLHNQKNGSDWEKKKSKFRIEFRIETIVVNWKDHFIPNLEILDKARSPFHYLNL